MILDSTFCGVATTLSNLPSDPAQFLLQKVEGKMRNCVTSRNPRKERRNKPSFSPEAPRSSKRPLQQASPRTHGCLRFQPLTKSYQVSCATDTYLEP